MANRIFTDEESIIGMMVNTLPLIFDLPKSLTKSQLLEATNAALFEAHAFQRIPFDVLVEELKPERNLGQNPIYQIAFNFHNAPVKLPLIEGVEVCCEEALSNSSAKMDMNIVVLQEMDGLTINWEFNTDLYEVSTINSYVDAYLKILADVFSTAREDIHVEDKEPITHHQSTGMLPPAELSIVGELPKRQTIEWLVKSIWKKALNRETVEQDQNFFDLGGHSLLALRIIDEIEQKTLIKMTVQDFFENPTLSSQLRHLATKMALQFQESQCN